MEKTSPFFESKTYTYSLCYFHKNGIIISFEMGKKKWCFLK